MVMAEAATRERGASAPGAPAPASPLRVVPGLDPSRRAGAEALYARALALWPRIDRRQLSRTHGDDRRIARLVARRTSLGEDAILRLLRG